MFVKLSLVLACLLLFSVTPVLAQTSTTTVPTIQFCEGNLDCDQDVDGTDASTFKADFGRNLLGNPCSSLFDCPSNPWQPCPEGMIVCSFTCVDPMTDEAHCGVCNDPCNGTCVNGVCQQVGCPPNFTWCDSECADTTTDEANCGGCGDACSSGEKCVAGTCTYYPVPVSRTGSLLNMYGWDDGYLQHGVPSPNPRFTDHENGTVTDNLTGLMWTKNANNCGGAQTWIGAMDCVTEDFNWACYAGYCDWVMPNVRELLSLIDFGNSSPALPSGHPFTGVQSCYYWSSTTYDNNTSQAWYVSTCSGDSMYANKTNTYYVWPVRGAIARPPLTTTTSIPEHSDCASRLCGCNREEYCCCWCDPEPYEEGWHRCERIENCAYKIGYPECAVTTCDDGWCDDL